MTDTSKLRSGLAEALHAAGGPFTNTDPETLADAVRAYLEDVGLFALVRDFVDPDPCEYDHHGYCQAHFWFETDPACPHARAKAMGLEPLGEDDE
ncbi:hypothetical protein [Streptomyces olivaceiscleroticus]|uniref:Uncharacterized protein n=1 Tax=Streptomyces olivaceiscleroticus TaxID=68245 RepID=A0ABP3LJ24_9ACTN